MKIIGLFLMLFFHLTAFSQVHISTGDETSETDKSPQKSQKQDKPAISDRIFFGGSFGAGFGDYTYFNISPIIGYKLTPTFSIGGGIIYQYSEDKYYKYTANNYGGRAFGIAKVYGPLFAQLEYEYLTYRYNSPVDVGIRGDYNSLLGGGGVAQPISKNAFFTFTALYNFLYVTNITGDYLPYDSPWVIRVGISAGF